MRKKRNFAWVLLSVCIVMLVASVFPHHHHGDWTLCTKYDMPSCTLDCQDVAHHHARGQECGNSCVTSFCCDAPQHFNFIRPISLFVIDWFTVDEICRLLFFEKQVEDYAFCYVEYFHSYDGQDINGLRAPPCA